jgi:dTDP-4-dehydrorhamnose 3,5-epimerase
MSARFVPTELPGVVVIEPEVHRDNRGFFVEIYRADEYARAGIAGAFVQDNHSQSGERTLRGLHLQLEHPQGKLVRVIDGEIWDVAVDVRRGSPTFGRWAAVRLSARNFRQCYIPPGFAHGYCVLTAGAQVEYKCTAFFDQASEVGIAWNDPALNIQWPITDPVLSDRDRQNPALAEVVGRLPTFL